MMPWTSKATALSWIALLLLVFMVCSGCIELDPYARAWTVTAVSDSDHCTGPADTSAHVQGPYRSLVALGCSDGAHVAALDFLGAELRLQIVGRNVVECHDLAWSATGTLVAHGDGWTVTLVALGGAGRSANEPN